MAESARASGGVISHNHPASDGDDDGDGTSWPWVVVPDETCAESSSVRKRRGRPPGTKNKPKRQGVVSKGTASSSMKFVFLHFDDGIDIVSDLSDFVRDHRVGLVVSSTIGAVSGISLHHSSSSHGLQGIFTLQGQSNKLKIE
ncbi:AT-hook motif nuclear-localized protein 16-like [Curcuma longa]|uniref:AT-hook motif nuclear-localized protein 16-like n=1 Tax=Curcuma longa TaxID=136217 RepID=UPI003D9F58B6